MSAPASSTATDPKSFLWGFPQTKLVEAKSNASYPSPSPEAWLLSDDDEDDEDVSQDTSRSLETYQLEMKKADSYVLTGLKCLEELDVLVKDNGEDIVTPRCGDLDLDTPVASYS